MVVLIDLKMFMKAKYHFHVEIQIRSQVYNLPRFNLFCLLWLKGEREGGICLLHGQNRGWKIYLSKR